MKFPISYLSCCFVFLAGLDSLDAQDEGRKKDQLELVKVEEQKADVKAPLGGFERIKEAKRLVNEALYHEFYGRNAARNSSLEQAEKLDASNTRVKWQLGKVFKDGKWQSIDEIANQGKASARLVAYQKLRDSTADTEQGQLRLAEFCQRNNWNERRDAHLLRVLQHNPNNTQVRNELGFVQVNGRWNSADEIENMQTRFLLDQSRILAWNEKLRPIQQDLFGKSKSKQQEAITQLKTIKDSSAVIAIELNFGGVLLAVDRILVDHFSTLDHPDATEALTRFAVYHPNAELRKTAASHLKKRDRYEYIPELLSTMRTPVLGQFRVFPNARGQIVYRHVFFQQLQESSNLTESNRVYQRIKRPNGDRVGSRRRALADAEANLNRNHMTQAARNMQISQLNERICDVLRTTTGCKINDDPRVWWQWWNDENEIYYANAKPINRRQINRLVQIVDQVPTQRTGSIQLRPRQSRNSSTSEDQSTGTNNQAERIVESTPPVQTTPPTQTQESIQITGRQGSEGTGRRSSGNTDRQISGNTGSGTQIQNDGGLGVNIERAAEIVEVLPQANSACECLVAGTVVETETGAVVIERIRAGDMVLTKAIDTGELSYQPVIRTTIRPLGEVYAIELENETIKASGGHPFWVSGQGWIKARNLKSGMPIHTVNGVVTVASVDIDGKEETFNLVVANQSNYFVGKSRILSHDNSLREATQVTVPGFVDQE